MEENGFKLVTKGHPLCAKRQVTRSTKHTPLLCSENIVDDNLYKRLVTLKSDDSCLKYSEYLKSLIDDSGIDIKKVVCYGIGRVSSDLTAQYQLSVLLCLMEIIKVKQAFIYDPILTDAEIDVLEKFGLQNIGHNERCRHKTDVSTLFYMPHCSVSMYNNLLYANWKTQQLNQMLIIGNKFSSYFIRMTDKQLFQKSHYLLKIKDGFVETQFPLFIIPNIFNDTALHIFPMDKLQLLDSSIWKEHEEPFIDPNDEEFKI